MRVIEPVLLKEPQRELLPSLASGQHLEHLCVDARRHHPRQSRQPFVLWYVPLDHFSLVGLQVACGVFSSESAYSVDDRFNGSVEGTSPLTSAHQPVDGYRRCLC